MMSDIVKKDDGGLLEFLHSANFKDLPKPFAVDIFLFETYVAGTSYIENIELLAPMLNIEDKLVFYREPNNPYDENAIRIETLNGDKIGYVPKKDNPVFSRLMDAGKNLYGIIKKKEKLDSWLKIDIEIYLYEG